jgi:hypothetical protein
LIQNLQKRKMATPMNKTPPITPPAMAPTFGLLSVGLGFGLAIHVMWAQSSQLCGTSEQISP